METDEDSDEVMQESERTPLRRPRSECSSTALELQHFEEMASCPSNLYCADGVTNEYLLERSQTANGVLYTTYKDEATATVIRTEDELSDIDKSTSKEGKKCTYNFFLSI
ncbi:hypothetical protein ACF0H5_003087 [Mactra antiquata]